MNFQPTAIKIHYFCKTFVQARIIYYKVALSVTNVKTYGYYQTLKKVHWILLLAFIGSNSNATARFIPFKSRTKVCQMCVDLYHDLIKCILMPSNISWWHVIAYFKNGKKGSWLFFSVPTLNTYVKNDCIGRNDLD